MFWALNGATAIPRRASARHKPVTTSDFPASDDVPAIRTPLDVVTVLPTGAVYGRVRRAVARLPDPDHLCLAMPLPLSNRDLLGGRRTRWRHRDRHWTANRLCECCPGREYGRRWRSNLRGHRDQRSRRTQRRRPTDCCSRGSIGISHGHAIPDATSHSINLAASEA